MKSLRVMLSNAVLALIIITSASAWAGSHVVYVPPPNGTDDTANIQAGLDKCVAYGNNCTVQLAAGTYLTRQLVAYNFRGTFKGMGKGITVIEALPYLPVTVDFTVPCQPNTTTCLWPTLMIFVDGDISISDLSIHMIATDGTATDPWPQSGSTFIETGIRLMGQYSTTNVHIARIEEEGRPDSTSGFGFNVNNGIMYTGEFSNGSANPVLLPCGAAGGFYFLSGSYTVRNSSFKSMGDGVSQDGCVRSAQVTIGGSPSTGNSFEDHFVGIDLESAESSIFNVSYNKSSGIGFSMWVVPWIPSVFEPSKPSRYLIHDNTFSTTGPGAAGIFLYNDILGHSWINGVVWNNNVQLQDPNADGIDAVNAQATTILNNSIANNSIAGTGHDAIALYGTTSSAVVGNNLSDYTPDPSLGGVQIYLDPGTRKDLVVCADTRNTVLNQGANNLIVGCQELAATPQVGMTSAAPETTRPELSVPTKKLSPFRP